MTQALSPTETANAGDAIFFRIGSNQPGKNMREMTMLETEQVGAALSLQHGIDLIGGIAAVCAVIPGLQGVAAFAAGVDQDGAVVVYFLAGEPAESISGSDRQTRVERQQEPQLDGARDFIDVLTSGS